MSYTTNRILTKKKALLSLTTKRESRLKTYEEIIKNDQVDKFDEEIWAINTNFNESLDFN